MMGERRIGAFGGTFDPVHSGHVEIARAVVRNFGLDQLLIVPAHRPPHKDAQGITGAYHRYTMAALATLDEPRVIVSTIELESPERPYTFETIERLHSILSTGRAGEPGTRLFFVMGADSFQEINTWREPARLLSSTDVIVVTRPGHGVDSRHLDNLFKATIVDLGERDAEAQIPCDDKHRIYLTRYVNNSVSSTQIRQKVFHGESIVGLVPPRVADYINKYELYRC